MFFPRYRSVRPRNLFAWTERVEVNRKPSSETMSCGSTGGVWIRTVFVSGTHGRYEELLDLLHRSPHLDLGSGLRVLHRDQDVEVFVEVLPVWLASVLLLLRERGEKRAMSDERSQAVPARMR